MASSIPMGLLPCCCFASRDVSKDSSPSVLPLSSTGDSAPPLFWRLLRGGVGDAESRDYFGFSDLQKLHLAVWGKGGVGAGV